MRLRPLPESLCRKRGFKLKNTLATVVLPHVDPRLLVAIAGADGGLTLAWRYRVIRLWQMRAYQAQQEVRDERTKDN
jgi:hypothetical protein